MPVVHARRPLPLPLSLIGRGAFLWRTMRQGVGTGPRGGFEISSRALADGFAEKELNLRVQAAEIIAGPAVELVHQLGRQTQQKWLLFRHSLHHFAKSPHHDFSTPIVARLGNE